MTKLDRHAEQFGALGHPARLALLRHIVQGGPAGVTSFFDFPGTMIAAILAERFGLPGPPLESLFKCEHKYWSRLEQAAIAAEHVPRFAAVDPFAHNPLAAMPGR